MKILYVEDDAIARMYTEVLLAGEQLQLKSAEDGVQAMELFQQDEFDVVLTDIDMPNMDGIALLKAIHEIDPQQRVVALSAFTEDYEYQSLDDKGFTDIIAKPVEDIDVLLHNLQTLVQPSS